MKAIVLAAVLAAGPADAITHDVSVQIPGIDGGAFVENLLLAPPPSDDPASTSKYRVVFDLTVEAPAYLSLDQSLGEEVPGFGYFYTASGSTSYNLDLWGKRYSGQRTVSDYPYYSDSFFAYGDEYLPYSVSFSIQDTRILGNDEIWLSWNSIYTGGPGRITGTVIYSAVPLPASGLLLLAGFGVLATYRKTSRGLRDAEA